MGRGEGGGGRRSDGVWKSKFTWKRWAHKYARLLLVCTPNQDRTENRGDHRAPATLDSTIMHFTDSIPAPTGLPIVFQQTGRDETRDRCDARDHHQSFSLILKSMFSPTGSTRQKMWKCHACFLFFFSSFQKKSFFFFVLQEKKNLLLKGPSLKVVKI